MPRSRSPRRDKRVERRTTRQLQKHAVRRVATKAELRKRFDGRIRTLAEAISRFHRIPTPGDRETLLRDMIRLLDACLEEKPQSHLLREQRRICIDALQDLLRDPDAARRLTLESLLDDPARVRVILKARIHPPASDRKSWN